MDKIRYRKLSDDDELSLNLHLNDYDDVNLAVVTLENVPNCLHICTIILPPTCFSSPSTHRVVSIYAT
jgi:hypothetical protein